MPDLCTYDYAIVRVVPHVERGEFVNAGVIVLCTGRGFLQARVELDESRLLGLDPAADLPTIRAALSGIPAICAGGERTGPIGRLSLRERFDWLVAPRSTSIQVSAVHSGRCTDLEAALAELVARTGSVSARAWLAYIRGECRTERGAADAAPHLRQAIALAEEADLSFLAGVARHTLLTTAARVGGDPAAVLSALGALLELECQAYAGKK